MEVHRASVEICHLYIVFVCLLTLTFSRSIEDSQEDYYRHYPSAIPSFLPVPTNITVHEGETAYMRCRIHNLGPKTVVWRKSNEESPLTYGKIVFTPDKNVEVETEEITEDENRWDLIIKNVSQEQAGVYACQVAATNNYTLNITLNVIDPVEYKPELKLTGTAYVSLMDDIHLTCNATGSTSTPNSVDWFFNGEPVDEIKEAKFDGRLVELNRKPVPGRSLISELIVKRVKMEDRGHYVCRLTKDLAHGFKVHVLNDIKNHVQRGTDDSGEKSDTMESRGTNKSKAYTAYHATLTLLLGLFFAVFI